MSVLKIKYLQTIEFLITMDNTEMMLDKDKYMEM